MTEGVTLPPRPWASVLSGLSLRASFARTQFSVGRGDGGWGGWGFKQCHCVWQQSRMLDLIRLHEPGEREGAKAALRNCFPFPPNRLFFPVSRPRPLLGWKRLYHLLSTKSLWCFSSQPGQKFDLPVLPPFCLSFPPTSSQTECFSHLPPPSSGPARAKLGPGVPWHPHESPSC